MQKVKAFFKGIFKKDGFMYKALSKIYHFFSKIKYNLVNGKKIKEEKAHYSEVARQAVSDIHSYNNSSYIVFYTCGIASHDWFNPEQRHHQNV